MFSRQWRAIPYFSSMRTQNWRSLGEFVETRWWQWPCFAGARRRRSWRRSDYRLSTNSRVSRRGVISPCKVCRWKSWKWQWWRRFQVRLVWLRFCSMTAGSSCPTMDILLPMAWIRSGIITTTIDYHYVDLCSDDFARRKQTGWLTTWPVFTGGWKGTLLKASSVSGTLTPYILPSS